MEILTLARELGHAVQQSEEYIDFRIKEQNVESVLDIIDRINEIGQGVIFLGDGVVPYKNEIENNIKVDYSFAPPHLSRQRAGAVAALAMLTLNNGTYKNGKKQDAKDHVPDYLRLSQAERERLEKINASQN